MLVGLAFLVFELTADPSLAVVLGCLKFGTADMRVARWLRRADPDSVRGCACSWFYVVLAIMRIGFMAVAIMFVFFVATGAGFPRPSSTTIDQRRACDLRMLRGSSRCILDCRGIVSPEWHSRLDGRDREIGHEERGSGLRSCRNTLGGRISVRA